MAKRTATDLSQSTVRFESHYDPEAFGRASETVARVLGTGRFLVVQTVLMVSWMSLNVSTFFWTWDEYPYRLLNLAFSVQAAYAAPLILLSQSRQDERDRGQAEVDRAAAARTKADTDYLAHELAAVRLTLADVATARDATHALDQVVDRLHDLDARLLRLPGAERGGGAELGAG